MDIYDQSFIAKGKLCFQSAEKLAKSPETLRRVEEEELQILYADLCRRLSPAKWQIPRRLRRSLPGSSDAAARRR